MNTVENVAEEQKFESVHKVLAWGVHLLTAFGAVAGLFAIAAIVQGRWRLSFVYMAVALAIDGFDGALARRFRVAIVLPGFDGALLDNIVDYFTFVIVPAVYLYASALLPARLALAGAAMIALASAYQFCQADAKTDDHYFKGFPSYWNIVVYYMYLFAFSPWINLIILTCLAVLVFIPIKYVYPSRNRILRRTTIGFGLVWGACMIALLVQSPDHPPWFVWATMSFIAYYAVLSLYFTFRPAGNDSQSRSDLTLR